MCAARVWLTVLATTILLLGEIPAAGQSLSIRLAGVVLDVSTGLPIQDAMVRVNVGEYICVTDAAGRFAVEHLPAGEYALAASRLGYASSSPVRVMVSEDVARVVCLRLEPQPIELPGQRVTGTRFSERSAAHPSAVLTREQIHSAGFRDVAEALASLPGIMVNPGRSSSGTQEITIRGERGKRIAVTLDGVRLAEGVRGTADLSAVPLSAVERIEVRREGEWGDAAIGGVVQITTRRSFSNEQTVATGYGAFDTWQASATTSRNFRRDIGALVTGEVTGSGDTYTFVNEGGRDSTRGNTALRTRKVFARVGGQSGPRRSWGIWALFHESGRGAPGAVHLSTPQARMDERRRLLSAEWAETIAGALSVTVQGSASNFRTRYRDPVTFPAHSRFDETSYVLSGVLSFVPETWSPVQLRGGVEIYRQELQGVNYLVPQRSFGRATRSAHAFWGRGVARSPVRWPAAVGSGQVACGLRYDHDGRSSDFWAPQMSLAWGWGRSRWMGFSAEWGRAFRRPLLTSLFWKQDVFSSGNPELAPEKSREWNAGFELRPPGISLSLGTNFFDRVCDGFIEWEKRYGGVWSPVNMPRAALVGREDACAWSPLHGRLTVGVFHTLLWATDQSADRNYRGKVLLFRPRHTYQLQVQSMYRGLEVRGDARWVDKRFTRKQNTKWLAPYRWVDLSARQTIHWRGHQAVLSLVCENFTNEPAALLEGYPLPGRSFRVRLELRW